MPPVNLLIFPIIGGYYILIKAELFRYRQQRLEPQKLIFNSFLGGIILMISSWIITGVISCVFPAFTEEIRKFYPIKAEYFGTCVCSFLLAIVFTQISNVIVSKNKYVSKAIHKIGNEFERLCESCYRNVDMIQVTLKNDKCYVGWIQSLPIPTHSSYITLLPVYSGYRTKETKELKFNTQYLDVYASYVKDGEVQDVREITSLVIKIDEIVSANKFDPDMYDRFKGNKESALGDSSIQ
jgi:hypothetical protein